MAGVVGFSFMHWFGTEGEYNVLVTSTLGPTLESMLQTCEGKFSLKTILLLSDQIISRLEDLHAKYYVYRKISPENLHMGHGKFGDQVSIANLGHAQKYMAQESHIPYSQGNSINVTDEYSSINAHNGIVESYCDNLQSLLYVMRRLCGGEDYPKLTLENKCNMTPEELFCGFPAEFPNTLSYIKSLLPGEKPDYRFLRRTFRDLFARLSFEKDYLFDWVIYKYDEDRTSRTNRTVKYGEGRLLAQFTAQHLTAQQMEDDVNGFLHGLSEAEKICKKIHEEQLSGTELTDEQSRALITAHRKVLDRCCDFSLVTWHPSSPESLRLLTKTKRVPDRMWHNGIYSLFELRRHYSVHHSLAFLRFAYSMAGLLRERAPSNEAHIWKEMLGELARCYLGISREVADAWKHWSGVARTWFNEVADEYPHNGRLQHNLGTIAGPEIIQQLFHYAKALISVTPFPNTWLTLFESFWEKSKFAGQRYSSMEFTFVKAHGALFKHRSIPEYRSFMAQFRSGLRNHGRFREEFIRQSSKIAFILCAAACDFGGSQTLPVQEEESLSRHALLKLGEIVSEVCADGEEILSFMHVVLVYLHDSACIPHFGRHMPWDKICRFVNTLRKYVVEPQSEAIEFPQQQTVAGRQLPEDFDLRGLTFAQGYFPLGFFDNLNPSTKERMEERPDYAIHRAKRIWHLTYGLAAVEANRYLEYDSLKQEFSIKTKEAALLHCFGLSANPSDHQGSS